MCNVMWRTRAHTSTYIYYIISMCNGAHAHAHACTHTACVTSAMFSINTSMQCACTVVVWVSGCSGVTVCLVGVNVLRMLVVPPLPSSPPSPPNTRRAGQEYQGLLSGLHRARNHSYVLSAWIPHVGTSLQFGFRVFGRCDAHGRDSSPHAGDCKRTPPPPPSLQHRYRQGTQGQRQVDAGLWTEKVGIAYN